MHAAYLDGDANNNNIYNNPYYHSSYSNQPDSQYPYGFPIPGLTNQQQAGLYQSANQIYQSQNAANQNGGGQYYMPGLVNQNQGVPVNLLPVPVNQINQKWPLSNGIGSQVYQNNIPYQTGQQQNYIPAQTGFIQNPAIPIQQVNQNLQPVQQSIAQGVQQVQPNQVPNNVVNQNLIPMPHVATRAPVAKPDTQNKVILVPAQPIGNHDTGYLTDHVYETVTEGEEMGQPGNRFPADINAQHNEQDGQMSKTKSSNNFAFHEGHMDENAARENEVIDHPRHSEEVDDELYDRGRTYPPSTKTKTQIGSPTQSTVSGQKSGQIHSEGFSDYSWMKYDNDSPSIGGKKGKAHSSKPSQVTKAQSSKPSQVTKAQSSNSNYGSEGTINNTHKQSIKTSNKNTASKSSSKLQQEDKLNNYIKPSNHAAASSQYNDEVGNSMYDADTRYPDDFRSPYNDYHRPSKNRRPSYDRYDSRYDSSRRRPSTGSRYPYYDSGYQRDHDRYPVWDPYKDEYYYPDTFDNNRNLDYDARTGTRGVVT